MATIDLGKVAFTHKGTYNSGTTYEDKDVVQYTDGDITSTFVYINSTSASGQTPSTGGTVNTTYWSLMAKGQPQSLNANALKNDISALALRQASDANKTGYNTETSFVDVFQDNSNVANLVSTGFNSGEYMQVSASSDSSVTLQASNYQTYLDLNNVSFMRDGSGADRYNPTISPNTMYYGSSTGLGSQNAVVSSTEEATLMGYLFAQNGSTSQYMIDTNNSENRFNFALKAGKTFAPTSFNFRWQNGSGSFTSQNLYGVDSSYSATELYSDTSITNGQDNTNSFSNSTFFPNLTIRTKHSSTNGFMWDYLRIGGTMREIGQGAGDGSFTNNAITASSTVTSMGAVITYEDNAGTNALNTDIVLKLSADNGSNYTTATLVATPNFATGIKMAKVNDVTVTGGTQLLYKLEIKNQVVGSKEARIRGVALQF
tara:strand:+ start:566 stop:1855 length:1290 start_codon:yes stop_codon:yes gene_type:complete